jgi:F-type H+-transporting ATPase subunit delta
MSLAVAKQYAQALYDSMAPLDSARAQSVAEELEAFGGLLDESRELRTILLNPAVTPGQKKALVVRLAGQIGVSDTRNFLQVVIDRRRIGIFREIREAFEELVSAEAGLTRAQVTAARELSAEQKQGIEAELAALTESAVRCRYDADESLLGGAVVQIGSTVYDGSIRGQIEALRRRLTE